MSRRALRFGFVLALLCLGVPAQASVFEHPANVAELSRMLAPATRGLDAARSVRGAYRQTKQLAELPRPLVSEGDFLFARDLGIAWRTRTPFASELLITPDALVQRSGGAEQRVDAREQPAVRTIASVFFAVFSLDFEALSGLFELYGEQATDGSWTLGLRPRQPTGAVDEIEVSGGRSVDQVLLRERGGDRTRIELSATELSATELSADDRARFALR